MNQKRKQINAQNSVIIMMAKRGIIKTFNNQAMPCLHGHSQKGKTKRKSHGKAATQ